MGAAGFAGGGRGHELRDVGASGCWKRQGDRLGPRASRRRAVLLTHFRLPTSRAIQEQVGVALGHSVYDKHSVCDNVSRP